MMADNTITTFIETLMLSFSGIYYLGTKFELSLFSVLVVVVVVKLV